MSTKPWIIKVDNLTKYYGDFKAVDNVSFEVKEGEIFGFLGPNGAGKSSTINMLTGLSRITSGSYQIYNQDFHAHQKKFKKMIGIVPDESNMYDELTGLENLSFSASLYGIDRNNRVNKANKLLKEFNLHEAKDKLYRFYSKGMKRKLTIAAALIHEPKILILDEPTTGIDVKSAREIRAMIKRLNTNGITVFLTTHYLEEAERLCSRIAFIVKGQIVKIAQTTELINGNIRKNSIEFSLNKANLTLKKEFEKQFPDTKASVISDTKMSVELPHNSPLYPYIAFFNDKGITVFEAKEAKLSLEEVFVRITGIESDKISSQDRRSSA